MQRLSLLTAVLVAGHLLASNSPNEFDGRTVFTGLEGSWRLVSTTFESEYCDEEFRNVIITYRKGRYTSTSKSGIDTGSYTVDTRTNPSRMDDTRDTSCAPTVTHRYVYQIDGDRLRIAGDRLNSKRPASFNDPDVVIYSFTRVTK
jgi:uncharacterized protein (TIGR03067 family)